MIYVFLRYNLNILLLTLDSIVEEEAVTTLN